MNHENDRSQNSNVGTENVPHSGSDHLPEDMREQPVRDFDKTPLSDAYESGLVKDQLPEGTTPAALVDSDARSEATAESKPWYKSMMVKIGAPVVGIAAAGALVAGLMIPKGDSEPKDNVPVPNPDATSQTTGEDEGSNENEGGNENQNSAAEVILNNPSRVSAEQIAAMSPAELNEFTTIKADASLSPEDFSKQFVTIYDAWVNAGATSAEAAPYIKAGKGVYEAEMAEKYDATFKANISPSSDTTSIEAVHNSVINGFGGSQLLEKEGYTVAVVYKSSEVISNSGTTNGFVVRVTADIANNVEASGLSEFNHEKDLLSTVTWELTVGELNGNYVIASFEKIEE